MWSHIEITLFEPNNFLYYFTMVESVRLYLIPEKFEEKWKGKKK